MKTWLKTLALLLAALYSAAALPSELIAARTAPVTDEDIDRAVRRGRGALSSSSGDALTALALLNAGVPADDRALSLNIRRIAESSGAIPETYLGTYQAGITLSLLAAVNDARYTNAAAALARKLERMQDPAGGWGDNSRTQFALLGLKSARALGVPVSPATFELARDLIERRQNSEGGWGYFGAAPPGYNSMTAAGVSSLHIVLEDARKSCPVCGAADENFRLNQGIGWLGKRLNLETLQPHHFYYLYSIERVGVLLGQKYFGGRDWYREGAGYLVRTQNSDGSWSGDDRATEFALLFLAKGRAPIAINKLQYGRDWNPDPYDASELSALAARDLKTPMSAQVIGAGDSLDEFRAAPILYLQGRNAFAFTPELRTKIKAFVEQGGFIVASNCCGGSDGFNASFRAEMKELFPENALARLPDNHEIFSIQHTIANPTAFELEGLSTGCRPAVFYAPHDVCCAWSGCKGCLDKRAPQPDAARDLGVNIVACVLRYKALKAKLAAASPIPPVPPANGDPRVLKLGQICYSGEWNPDPEALNNLAKYLKEVAKVRVSPQKDPVVLGETQLGDYPVLYLTGHKNFQLNPSAEGALRSYLDRGGFLFCDACCGKPEFDAAFRRLCTNIYPEGELTRISPQHSIFREPYQIEKVAYKPAAKLIFPMIGAMPFLEGITGAEGRITIAYSKFNLGCELQNHPCAGCIGVEREDAFKLSVNAIVYALSH